MTTISLPILEGQNVITHSRMATFAQCPQKHHYKYELGVRRAEGTQAQRFGTLVHGMIATGQHVTSDTLESRAAFRLVECYHTYWSQPEVPSHLAIEEVLATEYHFEVPITGAVERAKRSKWRLSGMVDAIVRLRDGRLAIRETKTASRVDDTYWAKLDRDEQITTYLLGLKLDGKYPNVDTVLYDVIVKPELEIPKVPILDENGEKIVLDRDGNRVQTKTGTWRQTGDQEKGYVVQTRDMTLAEFGDQLTVSIYNDPTRYFQRREIPRLSTDIEHHRISVANKIRAIEDSRKKGRRWTNSAACYAYNNLCEFASFCPSGVDRDRLPSGFVALNNVHPEIQ